MTDRSHETVTIAEATSPAQTGMRSQLLRFLGAALVLGLVTTLLVEPVAHVLLFGEPWLDALVYGISAHEWWMRLVILVCFLAFGYGAGTQVAKRMATTQALQRSTDICTDFVEGTADLVLQLDDEGRIRYANLAAQQTLRPREGDEGALFSDCLSPEGAEDARDALARILEGHTSRLYFQCRLLGEQGRVHEVECAAHAHKWFGESMRAVTIIARDMTAQRAAEQAVRESEQIFRSVADEALAAVLVTDVNGRIVVSQGTGDRALVDIHGAFVGRHASELPTALGPLVDGLTGALVGSISRPELKLNDRTYDVFCGPRTDASGRVLGALGLAVDVTSRERAESRWRILSKRLEVVVALTEQLIRKQDVDEVCRHAVELARERLGVERAAIWLLEGGAYSGAFGTDLDGNTRDERGLSLPVDDSWRAMASAPTEEGRRWTIRAGELMDVDENGALVGTGRRTWAGFTPIMSGDDVMGILCNDKAISGGPPDRLQQDIIAVYVSLVGNIIARIRAENDQAALRAHLERTQRLESLGVLAGGIAHNFNNILSGIRGFSELAMAGLDESAREWGHLQRVIQGSERAAELVKQILTFSRRAEPEWQPVDLCSVVEQALSFLRSSLSATIRLDCRMSQSPVWVLGDPTHLYQVALNLGANACHAMGREGGVLTVTIDEVEVGAEATGDLGSLGPGRFALLTVSDTGHGMSEEALHRCFELFYTTKPVGEGTGLGLAVVHGIVMKHRGCVVPTSCEGKGTSVSVYLPAHLTPAQARSSALTERVESMGAAELKLGHVLLVDDEENVATMAQHMLASLGYSVEMHLSSTEALAAFCAAPDTFDIIVTDQTMPCKTGAELVGQIRQVRPEMPVLMVTGYDLSLQLVTPEGTAPVHVLMKPFSTEQLKSALQELQESQPWTLDAP